MFGQAQQCGKDDAQPGDLRNGKIGEDHAALQHLHAERDVRCKNQQTRDERGQQNIQFDIAHFSPANKRWIVSSNIVNKSLACGVPPTVNGNITAGICARSAIHSEGRSF